MCKFEFKAYDCLIEGELKHDLRARVRTVARAEPQRVVATVLMSFFRPVPGRILSEADERLRYYDN